MRPKDYEFTEQIKGAALYRAGYKCEDCGVEKASDRRLNVHHKLGIAYALRYYPSVPPTLIRSLANAEVLCDQCHLKKDNALLDEHSTIAAMLVGMLV